MPTPIPVQVASSVSDLATKVPLPIHGQIAVIRVGIGANAEDIELGYHGTLNRWIELDEHETLRSNDQLEADTKSPHTTKQELKSNTLYDAYNTNEAPIWGFHPVREVAAKWAAGLTLLYRQAGWMKGSHEEVMHTISASFALFEIDSLDAYPTMNPAAAWAETAQLVGGAQWPTSVPNFQWQETGWTQLLAPGGGALSAPTKRSLMAVPFGFMEAGTGGKGGVRSHQLYVKWASR